jgi:hypothetical protein
MVFLLKGECFFDDARLVLLANVHECLDYRVTLKAFNLPAIKVFPDSVKIGHCPDGEIRHGLISIENLLPIDCPCVLVFKPSDTYSMFTVSPSQVTLLPREKRDFQITFSPFISGPVRDTLVIISLAGEVNRVSVDAFAGQSLRVLESKVDFGPTDIFYGSVTRKITLKNENNLEPLPVHIEGSTFELTVDNGRKMVLRPGETKQVDVKFLSAITGQRQELLHIHAPNAIIPPLEIEAFSGPALCIPVMEDIIFPTTLTLTPSSIKLPITNLSSGVIQCLVTLPPLAPFSLRLMDPEFANRKTLERISLAIELKPFEGPDAIGGILTVGPKLTAVVEIAFLSATWGTFRVPLTVQMTKPRKMLISTYQLSAVAVNEAYLSRDSPIEYLEKFIHNPSLEIPSGVLLKRSADGKPLTDQINVQKSSEVFDIDPSVQMCFGAGIGGGKLGDVFEFVTLTNVTPMTHKYRIILSKPFTTDIELSGELGGMSCLEIPVRLKVEEFSTEFNKHMVDYTAIGQLTVFDDNNNRGMVSCSLYGTYGDLVGIEVRKEVDIIKFPALRVMDKHSKRIYLHNKAPFETVWEGRISVADRFFRVDENNGTSEWSPFGLNTTRVNLKPFEFGAVDVLFQATSSGDYYAKLLMTYIDPVNHVVNNEYQKSRAKRSLRFINFSCTVGLSEIDVKPESLNFGDVVVSDKGERSLVLQNNQNIEADIMLNCPEPFTCVQPRVRVPKGGQVEVDIMFQSVLPKRFAEILTVTYGARSLSIPMFAISGTSQLSTNLAKPIKVNPNLPLGEGFFSSDNCIDFKFVNVSSPKVKCLQISNLGTLELNILAVVSVDETHLQWKFADEAVVKPKSPNAFEEETEAYWNQAETDWDEIAFKEKDDKMAISATPVILAEAPKAVTVKERKKKHKAAATQQQPMAPVFAAHKNFPLRLPPLQNLCLLLSFGGSEKVWATNLFT